MKTRPRQDNSQSIVNDIEATLGVLQTVRNDLLTNANYSVPKSHLSIFRILDKRFWRFSLSRREITNSLPCETFQTYVNPVEFLTEKQTDRCLLEITQQRFGVCSITDQCARDMLDQMDCTAGYSGTHQLLFLLSYWRMNCGHYLYPSFDEILSNCSREMYSQFCAIQNEDYPSKLQDIYLEYVLFGGLAGFDEFLQEDILRKIIQWQHIDGCYYVSDDTEQSEATIPQKSNGKRFSSHVTALKRLRLTLETLKKSLTCMTSNPNASDINSMVGLSVTAGKLKQILLTWKIPFTQRGHILKTILKESLKEVEMTRRNVYATLADSELSHIRLSDGIFQVDFWNFELPKKRLTLGSECDRFHVDPRYTEFISEVMSNKCLSEVSAPRVGKCRLSEECVDHMIRQPGFKGYSGTHKLFYVIAALRMNCATKAPFLRRMTVAGGEKMIQYACAIANLQFPEDHQDLFLEYVLFGSIAGYDEILQDDWLTKLTEWQAEDGCYYTSALGSLGYLEMVHKTAVAVGVLGSYIALIISQLL